MSLRKMLGKIFLFVMLEVGALSGMMTPQEIEKLMKVMNAQKIVQMQRNENGEDVSTR